MARTLAGAILAMAPGPDYFAVSVTPKNNPKLQSADYLLWAPEGSGPLRGVILRQHGCGAKTWMIGLNLAQDLQWQALARKHRMALMSSRYVAPDACEAWTDLSLGSDALFLEALEKLARLSGRPELADAPWVLSGHSGGARWSAAMLLKYPARTLAAVLARCGETAGANAEAARVPVLWVPATKDHLARCVETPIRSFREYRRQGALWTLAVDPAAGHELAELRTLAIPYLDAVLSQRLPAAAGRPAPMQESRAWLGDPATFAVSPAASYAGDPRQAAWLPDEAFARRWREFVSTGRAAPARPLPAPYELRVEAAGAGEVELTWRFDIGLEHGAPAFAVLRDGNVVGGAPGQAHGYHDDPSPLRLEWRYRDRGLAPDRTYRYRVVPLAEAAASSAAEIRLH